MQTPSVQVSPVAHPGGQVPPHRSGPHSFPPQLGVQQSGSQSQPGSQPTAITSHGQSLVHATAASQEAAFMTQTLCSSVSSVSQKARQSGMLFPPKLAIFEHTSPH